MARLALLTFAALALLSVCCPSLAAIEADKITSMPNYSGSIPFDQYAGYITVDATAGRALYYWYEESCTTGGTEDE